jgi:hypothetical protein
VSQLGRVHIPVQGGKLWLCFNHVEVNDELVPDDPPVPVVDRIHFEYDGYLPRDLALELVRRTPDSGMKVNGGTVLEYLEGL